MTSWRDVLRIHPAADLFPMMSPEELRGLGEDIKANGLRVPVVAAAMGPPPLSFACAPGLDLTSQMDGGYRKTASLGSGGVLVPLHAEKTGPPKGDPVLTAPRAGRQRRRSRRELIGWNATPTWASQ